MLGKSFFDHSTFQCFCEVVGRRGSRSGRFSKTIRNYPDRRFWFICINQVYSQLPKVISVGQNECFSLSSL